MILLGEAMGYHVVTLFKKTNLVKGINCPVHVKKKFQKSRGIV